MCVVEEVFFERARALEVVHLESAIGRDPASTSNPPKSV